MRPHAVGALCMTIIVAMLIRPTGTAADMRTSSPHEAQTAVTTFPYAGTAEVTYTALPRFDAPAAAAEYAGHHQVEIHFAVRDRSHFRVDVQTVAPAIDSGTFTEVVDGSTASSYDARSGTAFKTKISRLHRAPVLDELLSALESGATEPAGLSPLPDPTKSVAAYLALLRRDRSQPGVRFRARIVGHDTLLGRPVDVIDADPIIIKGAGNTCRWTKTGTFCQATRFQGSGSARIWVDHEHPLILRYQARAASSLHDVTLRDATFSYRVTSITYGQGPTDQDLHLQPPVRVMRWNLLPTFMPFGMDSGPGPGVSPPGPFVYPGPPQTGGLTVSNGIQRLGYGPHYRIGSVSILFGTGKHGTAYFYKPLRFGPMPYVKGPYLLIQERLQRDGLPAALQVGASQPVGTCQAWTGAYPDGQRWLAFARKNASVLISTNALTTAQLVGYVARDMCA